MGIIDIREYCNENFEYVKYHNNKVYYCKGWELENKWIIDFYFYDIKENIEHKINKIKIITSDFYNKKIYLYKNNIIIPIINDNEIKIFRIDMDLNIIDEIYKFQIDEEIYSGIDFLGMDYFILYIDESNLENEKFDVQKDIQGEYIKAILYNIKDCGKYEILDKRIVLGVRDYLEYFNYKGKEFLVFEEAYMEDWEQEEAYNENCNKDKYHRNSFRESINVISLNKFVDKIKEKATNLPFYQIHKTEIDGWTRYFGMDEINIYYRTKKFNTGIETIYAVNKETLVEEKICEIDFNKLGNNKLRYHVENRKIYSEHSDELKKYVKGIYNSNLDINFEKKLGNFHTVLDDEYLLTYYWEEDSQDNYYDYMVIKNLINNEEKLYQGLAYISGDLVILCK
ncbi:MAG: hypothetical protein ACERKV_07585 [Clostridiaceae bacterium]